MLIIKDMVGVQKEISGLKYLMLAWDIFSLLSNKK
jgi:hypothetical protein